MTPAQAAQELIARRLARQSFLGFCEYKLRDTDMALSAHHKVIIQALDEAERGDNPRVMLMLPPGSAKSTYASVYFPEYFLGRNPQLKIISASHTSELAENFGRRVRNAVAEPAFRNMWNTGLSEDSKAAGRWSTEQGGGYFSVGVGGRPAGQRADVIVIDDPVGNREDADSERTRQITWDWYVNDILTRLRPGGRIVLVMTRWHEDDLAGRILEREREKWKVIKIPMVAGAGDVLGRAEGERLWKEWFTEEMLETAMMDPRSWISLYQQEPRPLEGAEFKRSWIQRYSHPPRRSNKIILVDPAGAQKKTSDFTSMWVVSLGGDNNAYIVDGLRDRLNLTQRVDALFDLHKKHRPLQVRYERYGMMGDVELIRTEMERRDYRFPLKEVAGQVDKRARIRRLIPWFENGRLWLPHEMQRTRICDGKTEDLMHYFIEQEYSAFPVARFDDAFDCMARLAEPSLPLPWPKQDEEIDDPAVQLMFGCLDTQMGY